MVLPLTMTLARKPVAVSMWPLPDHSMVAAVRLPHRLEQGLASSGPIVATLVPRRICWPSSPVSPPRSRSSSYSMSLRCSARISASCDGKPAGDGNSCGPWDDERMAKATYAALAGWYEKFPERKAADLVAHIHRRLEVDRAAHALDDVLHEDIFELDLLRQTILLFLVHLVVGGGGYVLLLVAAVAASIVLAIRFFVDLHGSIVFHFML